MPDEVKDMAENQAGTETETPAVETPAAPEADKAAQPSVEERLAMYEKRLADKDRYIGELSNKVGTLDKVSREQAKRQAEYEAYIEQQANPPRDYQAEMEAAFAKVDTGELPQSEALRIVAQLTKEQAKAEALGESQQFYEGQLQQERQQKMIDDWIKEEPGFAEFHERFQRGEFGQYGKRHPFYNDPVAAFLKHQAETLKEQIPLAEARGKQLGVDEIKKLSQGTGKGQMVLKDAGSTASQTKPGPLTYEDRRARAIEAMRKAKEETGF